MSIISAGQKAALLEAFHSAAALMPETLRSDFVLVGGTALLSLGGNRKTEDVDVAVTVPSLHAFFATAANDSRFKKGSMDNWEYTSTDGIIIPFEFLIQGGCHTCGKGACLGWRQRLRWWGEGWAGGACTYESEELARTR